MREVMHQQGTGIFVIGQSLTRPRPRCRSAASLDAMQPTGAGGTADSNGLTFKTEYLREVCGQVSVPCDR